MRRPAFTCALLLTLCVTLAIKYDLEPAVERLDLGGADWQFWNGNHSLSGPATVPGQIHMDLLHNKLIQDPYWRFESLKIASECADLWQGFRWMNCVGSLRRAGRTHALSTLKSLSSSEQLLSWLPRV